MVRTREVISCPVFAFPSLSVDLAKLQGRTLSVDYMLLRDGVSQELRYFLIS